MLPIPNFTAGILIGFANTTWITVNISCIGWGFIFCVYSRIFDADKTISNIEHMKTYGQRFLFNSPSLTFYSIEYFTALMTSLVIGNTTYLIKLLYP